MSRKRKYKKRSKVGNLKLKKQTLDTIGAIWLWLFAAIVTLSFFGEASVLVKLRMELTYQIGWTYYLLPPFLVSLSLLLFKVKSELGKPHVPAGFALAIISLTGLTQAGLVGEYLAGFISGSLGTEITIIIYLGIFVVSLIILFNTSLDRVINIILSAVQKGGDKLLKFFEDSLSGKRKKMVINDKNRVFDKNTSIDTVFTKPSLPQIQVSVKNTEHINKDQKEVKKNSDKLNILVPQNTPDQANQLWEYPPLTMLSDGPSQKVDRGDMKNNAHIIEKTLDSFGIRAKVEIVNPGPAVTQYALRIALGTKVSKITSLSSDLALALAAPTGQVRIEAPIPGRDLVGIEIPNRGLEFVTLKRMLSSPEMHKSKSKLSVSLGLDVSGNPLIADISKMPHVLVAGTTGSGKSVLINAWICSFLFRTTPQEVKMILVDPKRVELTGYNGVPHLLTPVIVEPDKILSSLRWATNEMDNRYKKFAEVGVRNIEGFNELSGFQAMPHIVILIDELADLMAYSPVEVEDSIVRLAQMARATGIHLVLATQRPSVDVITGLLKANIPTRVAFNVSSMIDSRVIIDMPGAEKLLGKGDMLYIPPDQSKPSRIQGTYVSDKEVHKVVEFLKTHNTPVQYTEEVLTQPHSGGKKGTAAGRGGNDEKDNLFDDALRLICQHDKASASLLQRRLAIGYARAARILDQLEMAGIIGPGEGAKPRDVLIKNPDDYYAMKENQEKE